MATASILIAFDRGSAAGDAPRSGISTVFVIVMENTSWRDIAGSASATYLNSLLTRSDASYATNYNSPRGNHPSTPNYLWLEAGGNLGVTSNAPPSAARQRTRDHLVTYLNDAGYSWKAYFQNSSIDGAHCPTGDNYPYPNVPFMLPFAFFDDVTGGLDPSDGYCAARLVSIANLSGDLARDTVANYDFIRVGDCLNMHDACRPAFDRIEQGDTWLASVVPQILNSRAYRSRGALFIAWDEGTNDSDGPMGLILLSPFARGHGYSSARYFTHSSLLKTIQEIFRVTPLLRDAASPSTADLGELFRPGTIASLPVGRGPG